jgi:hypothetical protein
MRDFFINGFEILVGVLIAILALGIIAAAGAAAFGGPGMMVEGVPVAGGPLAGLGILIGGFIYLIFVGGLMYLGLGIYQNTRRTAEAMEKLAASGR